MSFSAASLAFRCDWTVGPAPHFLPVLTKTRSESWCPKCGPQVTRVSIAPDLVRKASEWEVGGAGEGSTPSPQASLRPILTQVLEPLIPETSFPSEAEQPGPQRHPPWLGNSTQSNSTQSPDSPRLLRVPGRGGPQDPGALQPGRVSDFLCPNPVKAACGGSPGTVPPEGEQSAR